MPESKILTDGELDKKLAEMLGAYSFEERQMVKEFIRSQKIAHANMVIGKDEPLSDIYSPSEGVFRNTRNSLRNEQRQRNK